MTKKQLKMQNTFSEKKEKFKKYNRMKTKKYNFKDTFY